MKKKIHEICFRDVENSWDNALPVGNGRLGAMVFYEDHALHIALNHYDCYYQDAGQGFQDPARFRETYEELCRRADKARAQGNTAYRHYGRTLHPAEKITRPFYQGTSYPVGGELLLILDEKMSRDVSCLRLRIEEGRLLFEAGEGDRRVTAQIIAAREPDGVLVEMSQTEEGLWKSGRWMSFDEGLQRAGEVFAALKETGEGKEPKELGEEGGLYRGGSCRLAVSLQPQKDMAERAALEILAGTEEICSRHEAYWQAFWKSSVRLPDPFLERLWHMQLYLLECSSARGSSYPEQSWGLSGLWDIRRPNMWGSMWYWDVNIQSAFWGTYSAGHPELLELFCRGYLAYREDIYSYTKQVYGKKGWALDYPHTLYHCIQPWCAQFLWIYYQYSPDKEFLRQKAYPVFAEQIAFFKELAREDEKGIYHIEYDISPEQGPVTTDSVITVACVKKLLRFAIEAAKILERPSSEWQEYERLLQHMPAYPLTKAGDRYKDSALAQEDLFLRHPSVLMPLFPAEELDRTGGDSGSERKLWENTLRYATNHTETGTFGMGWLSAAAAKLGYGRDALRILYERGLDYVLHDNGLAYEESPRFLNYCHLTKPPHYLPVMMEAAGGIVNGVNLMLLQTGPGGEILVFPAAPKAAGAETGRESLLQERAQYREDRQDPEKIYPAWEDAAFYGLMAPGGFRVSARRKEGRVIFLQIESPWEAELKLLLPGELSERGEPVRLTKRMKAGEVLCFGSDEENEDENREEQEIPRHEAALTGRRIFLGANRHRDFAGKVDAFTCPYLMGNELRYPMTPYVFDFGVGEKDYKNAYPIQTIQSGRCLLYCGGPRQVEGSLYGGGVCGFADTENLRIVERSGPDDLRRDFAEGDTEAVFVLRLPKGKYDLLIVSGDEKEDSFSEFLLEKQGTRVQTGLLRAGSYGCLIAPLVQEKDGEMRLRIRTKEGYRWKLNALFVNKEYGL